MKSASAKGSVATTLTTSPFFKDCDNFLAFKTGIGHSVPEVSRTISSFSNASFISL